MSSTLSSPSSSLLEEVVPESVFAIGNALRIDFRSITEVSASVRQPEQMRRLLYSELSPTPTPTLNLSYGTAGFRTRYDLPMDYIFFRMAILAVLRSLAVGSKCVGMVITASHNPERDNGIKLVDSDGGMLVQSWEKYAELLVNAESVEVLLQGIVKIIQNENIDTINPSAKGVVIIGRDCRPHSAGFSVIAEQGVAACNGIAFDLGESTTPQVHFAVKHLNESSSQFPLKSIDLASVKSSYFDTIVGGYVSLLGTSSHIDCRVSKMTVDVAGGVGERAYSGLGEYLNSKSPGGANILACDLRNTIGSCEVNFNCGAEYVQKGQTAPQNTSPERDNGDLLCSIDGDADRIVFHLFNSDKWHLIDGDKIATLITIFLFDELKHSGLASEFSIGVVQTAYANGASSLFMKERGVNVVMAKTGVKFLHEKAHHFDIGIYFEANGHGTVLFSHRFVEASKRWNRPNSDKTETFKSDLAKYRLRLSVDTINQAVGDALSDMLICLAILELRGIHYNDWVRFYSDFPSKQSKLPVSPEFKATVICTEDETRIVSPKPLQDILDVIMADTAATKGRCFVRPSGTEDVVRVYAEASNQEDANIIADRCKDAIVSFL